MSGGENKLIRRRRAGAYVSSVISISLVLVLVGIATLLFVNARTAADYFKESVQISVLMKTGVSEEQAGEWKALADSLPFVNSTRLVTRAEGTAELEELLGTDFLKVFESSPVPVSVDVGLKADYVSPDSLAVVMPQLSSSPLVEDVSCQESLVEALNANLGRISLVLAIFISLMLFVSFVLIANAVRVNIFARRFTIRTMRLVGAERSFIRAPFIRDAVLQGLISSLVSMLLLAGGLLYVRHSFPQIFEVFGFDSLIWTGAIVVACGVMICVVSTFFTVNRLVSMSRDEMYY